MKRSTRVLTAVAVGTALLGTASVATAATIPTGERADRIAATTTAAGTQAAPADESTQSRRRPPLSPELRAQLRETGHIEIIRSTKSRGNVTVEVQRGEVTSVSATSITLLSKDGYSHSYVVTAETKVRANRQPVAISTLRVGERALVVAVRTPDGDVARRIGAIGAKKGANQQENG